MKPAINSTTRNFAVRQFLMVLLLLSGAVRSAEAASVTLGWTPSANPAVTGFIIYYGTASHTYTRSTTVGNVTSTTINGLLDGTNYFFAATTYDANGNQSGYSQEVSYTTPPPISPTIVTNEPPIVPTTPPVITNTPPNIPPFTNTPPMLTNFPPVIIPPVVTNTLPDPEPTLAPTLDPITDVTLRAGSALRSVVLTGLSGGSGQLVSVTATSSDPALVSNPMFMASSLGNAGTLIFKTSTNVTGSAVIIVTVTSDAADNNTITRAFTVNVAPATVTANLRSAGLFRKPGAVNVTPKYVQPTIFGVRPMNLLPWRVNRALATALKPINVSSTLAAVPGTGSNP